MTTQYYYSAFQEWFWNEGFWLPPGFHWKDFQNVDVGQLKLTDIYSYSIPIACLLFVLRNVLKTKVSIPFGKYLDIEGKVLSKNKKSVREGDCDNNNLIVENQAKEKSGKSLPKLNGHLNGNKPAEKLNGHLNGNKSAEKLNGHLNGNKSTEKLNGHSVGNKSAEKNGYQKVEKRNSEEGNESQMLAKFCEVHWKFLWYSCTSCFGFYAMYHQPWIWDVERCFTDNWPLQAVPISVKWYYILCISFTSMQLVSSIASREKKKDFWEFLVHDVTTILIVTITYSSNIIRLGSLIILIHEVGDVCLNFCKLTFYTKKKRLGDFTFFLFTFVWIVTRLIAFPYVVTYSYLYAPRPNEQFQVYPAMGICIGMVVVLVLLHTIWTYYIFRILMRVLKNDPNKGSKAL